MVVAAGDAAAQAHPSKAAIEVRSAVDDRSGEARVRLADPRRVAARVVERHSVFVERNVRGHAANAVARADVRGLAARAVECAAMSELDDQLAFLEKGSVNLIEKKDLRAKLQRGKPLTIKVGFDPTAPDIHLGHTVVMRKMRHFQQLGHRVIFLIGDFTGMIGDPTGKKSTRPALSKDEILQNAETYKQQVFKILDSQKTEIRFNS